MTKSNRDCTSVMPGISVYENSCSMVKNSSITMSRFKAFWISVRTIEVFEGVVTSMTVRMHNSCRALKRGQKCLRN